MKYKLSFLLFLSTIASTLFAQNAYEGTMLSSGKIYVVVAVILAIFIGIIIYLIYLERKLNRLEKQLKE